MLDIKLLEAFCVIEHQELENVVCDHVFNSRKLGIYYKVVGYSSECGIHTVFLQSNHADLLIFQACETVNLPIASIHINEADLFTVKPFI